MTSTQDGDRLTGVGALLMTLVLLWSGALAVGFGWAASVGRQDMGPARTVLFWIVAAFLGLIAARTGYELVRRARNGFR